MIFKKISITTALLSSLVVAGGGSVFAESQKSTEPITTYEQIGNLEIVQKVWDTPINYGYENITFKNNRKSGVVSKGVDMNGTVYEASRTVKSKSKSFEAVITNRGILNDSVSRLVSRRTFTQGKVGTSGETEVNWKLIKGKVGISAEVQFGKDETTTTTYTWNIPANTVTTIEYGSRVVGTKGSIVLYANGNAIRSNYVYADWSYQEYADKTPKPL